LALAKCGAFLAGMGFGGGFGKAKRRLFQRRLAFCQRFD
jgi:hypothetical protein